MARERDGKDSFDPRTWGGPGAGSGGPARAPAAAPAVAKPATPAPKPPPRPTSGTRPSSARATQTPLVIAAGVSLLVLVSGIAAARLYPSAPARPRTAAAPADSPAVAAAGELVVTGPAEIRTTLVNAGVAAEIADGIGNEAASMLGDRPGSIKLAIELTGPDGGHELQRLEASREDGTGVVLTAQPDGSYRSESK